MKTAIILSLSILANTALPTFCAFAQDPDPSSTTALMRTSDCEQGLVAAKPTGLRRWIAIWLQARSQSKALERQFSQYMKLIHEEIASRILASWPSRSERKTMLDPEVRLDILKKLLSRPQSDNDFYFSKGLKPYWLSNRMQTLLKATLEFDPSEEVRAFARAQLAGPDRDLLEKVNPLNLLIEPQYNFYGFLPNIDQIARELSSRVLYLSIEEREFFSRVRELVRAYNNPEVPSYYSRPRVLYDIEKYFSLIFERPEAAWYVFWKHYMSSYPLKDYNKTAILAWIEKFNVGPAMLSEVERDAIHYLAREIKWQPIEDLNALITKHERWLKNSSLEDVSQSKITLEKSSGVSTAFFEMGNYHSIPWLVDSFAFVTRARQKALYLTDKDRAALEEIARESKIAKEGALAAATLSDPVQAWIEAWFPKDTVDAFPLFWFRYFEQKIGYLKPLEIEALQRLRDHHWADWVKQRADEILTKVPQQNGVYR